MAEAADDPIAIVGIGCKVPGADNIRDFWRVLVHGENHVTEIPPSRWNADAFYDPDPLTPGKAYVKRAGLVKDPDEFDNKVYGINDFEAAQMDPQQRFVLDCTMMALEDAGLTRKHISGSDTGVFIGASNTDYRVLFRAKSSGVNNYTVTGISNSIMAARVSFTFDLRGPSLVLDTACSSSLIGIHLACQSIRAGECKMAIAGGTNFLTLPDVFVHLCKAGMMSREGQCQAFGSKADGYVRGEGCGVVVLKRLKDAERDGDKIWATIYTGSNQDGRTVSPITAPSGTQQQQLLKTVSSMVSLDLDRVDYIEAHGTGTSAGDPVEANALGEFFHKNGGTSGKVRYLGSVKSNIGHLESAAGVVGLIKVLLMMKHNTIAPSLFCAEPNPQINFPKLKLTVPGKPVRWESPNKVACCNSFGFGGSNSHAVIFEYKKDGAENSKSTDDRNQERPCIVALSACSEKSLRSAAMELTSDPDLHSLNIHDLSLTSTVRRDHYPVRVAHVVEDLNDLETALGEDLSRPVMGTAVYKKPQVTFVFGGMGTAWVGMGTELFNRLPVFRQAILQVEEELKTYVEWSLSERLRGNYDPQDPLFSPIAIFACQVALAAVWRDLDLEPNSVVGQSVGEVGAAHVAGCLTLAEAVKVIFHRSRLLSTVTGGKMLVVRDVPVEKTRQLVSKYGDKACVSLVYSPSACCISVDQDTAGQLRADLALTSSKDHKDMKITELHVPVAYHSPHVQPCTEPLAQALKDLNPQPPTIPLFSSVTGMRLTTAPDVSYWVDNLRKPVKFDQAMLQSRQSQTRQLFMEIGPKPVLRPHLPDLFPKAEVTCLASMTKPPELKVFLQAVGSVFESGLDLQWSRLPSLGTRITDLPRYVFDKRKNLLRTEAAAMWLSGVDEGETKHPFIFPLPAPPTPQSSSSSSPSVAFKLLVGSANFPSIYDHIVGNKVLMPGAVYAETGFAVANYVGAGRDAGRRKWSVSVDFEQTVTIPKDSYLEMDIVAVEEKADRGPKESLSSLDRAGGVGGLRVTAVKDSKVLANIRVTEITRDEPPSDLVNVEHVRARCTEKVGKDVIYGSLRQAGFLYGEVFCMLEDACTNDQECLCTLRVHPTVQKEMEGTTIHPAVLDCMLQSSLIIAGRDDQARELLPKALGRLRVHRALGGRDSSFPLLMVHTKLTGAERRQQFYDLKLLTTSGDVVLELEGLVINIITEAAQEATLEDLYVPSWTHVTSLPVTPTLSSDDDRHQGDEGDNFNKEGETSESATREGGKEAEDDANARGKNKNFILLTDRPFSEGQGPGGLSRVTTMSIEGMDFTQGLPANVQNFVTSNRKADALAVLFLEPMSENADANDADWHILNRSFLYKELLLLANRLSLTLPLYLCTCNAWPSPSTGQRDLDLPVNPAATGLWGLCRTVLSERIYPFTFSVDLQLTPETFTSTFLTSLFDTVTSNSDLKLHSELLVCQEGIFGNQIFPVNPSTSLPLFRVNNLSPKEDAILLSKESSAVVAPQAVPRDVAFTSPGSGEVQQERVHIRAHAFALQNTSLLKMNMPYDCLDQKRASKFTGFPVFALEVHGTVEKRSSTASKATTAQNGKTPKNDKSHKLNGKSRKMSGKTPTAGMEVDPSLQCMENGEGVVACFPAVMGTQVSVPASAALPSSLVPGYLPGDLVKLVLLQELQSKVEGQAVTLLVSEATRDYGQVLLEFFRDQRHSKQSYDTNVVMVTELTSSLKAPLHETVISLVLLDGSLITSLIASWNKAKTLITVSALFQSDAFSCASCLAPELELELVDTQLLFYPTSLKTRVPRLGRWLREKSSAAGTTSLESVMDNLHCCRQQEETPQTKRSGSAVDLSDLLTFDTPHMTNLQMMVSKDELFRKDSVYLVVGGLTGLGWLCVEYLAENKAGHIAILNRRQPSQEQLNNMATLAVRHNCHVTAFQGDVTSLPSLAAVFGKIEAAFPGVGLKGVFFGAAVTADKSFMSMDVPGFDSALSPKVRGTWNLHTLTKNIPLDYFVMHSSIASVIGNAGQANYAAGNAFMDGLAHYRRQRGLAGQSINWGVLDLGIISGNDSAREMLESRGFLLLSVTEIRNMLTPLLMLNWAQAVPIKLDTDRLSQRMYREGSLPLLTRMRPLLTARQDDEDEEDLLQVVHMAKSRSPDERLAIYERYVQVLVSRVLSVEISSVTLETSLLDLGLDSVGAMTLINQIHRDTSKRISAVELLSGDPTVLTVAESISEASEEDETGTGEGEGGSLTIEDVTEKEEKREQEEREKKKEDALPEASLLETRVLRSYSSHPRPETFHLVVDIPVDGQNTRTESQHVRNAIHLALIKCPAARTTFNEVTRSGKVTFRRSVLPAQDSTADLRVTEEEDGKDVRGRSADAHSKERLDLYTRGTVRFVLVRGESKDLLRVVLHKIAFDHVSAAQFAQRLRQSLRQYADSNSFQLEMEDSLGGIAEMPSTQQQQQQQHQQQQQQQWQQNILRNYKGALGSYWAAKLSDIHVSSPPSLVSSSYSKTSQLGSVKLQVAPDCVRGLKTFMKRNDVSLLPIIASAYQIVLHSLTGQTTIPLLFLLDMRVVHDFVTSGLEAAANMSSELPLLANFSPKHEAKKRPSTTNTINNNTANDSSNKRIASATTSLLNFVLENNRSIFEDIEHGVIPLSLLKPQELKESLLEPVMASTVHGITIEQISCAWSSSNGNSAVGLGDADMGTAELNLASKKRKHAWGDFVACDLPQILPLHLETGLKVCHQLHGDLLTLTLTFQQGALDTWRARVLLGEVMSLVLGMLSTAKSGSSVSKLASRRGLKLQRRMEKTRGEIEC